MISPTLNRFSVALAASLIFASFSPLLADDEPDAKKGDPNGTVAQQLQYIEFLKSQEPATLEKRIERTQEIRDTADKILAKVKDKDSDNYKQAYTASRVSRAMLAPVSKPAEQRKTLDLFKKDLGGKELEIPDLQLAMALAQGLEQAGSTTLAAEAYASFGELVAKSKSEEVRKLASFFTGPGRRLGLVGNEMKLSGSTLAGKAFDVASLKGKVVLVDFWATWCGPCRAEHPNIARNYKIYKERGFEVVGVSLDANRGALERYVKEHEVPWITLHEKEGGGKHPAAEYYGISGIPAMFLIGKDGKVVSLSARGEELNRLLAKLLGPPEGAEGK